MGKYDFIAIGDTVTDAFIQLEDAAAHIDIDHEVREICMKFGEKIPYKEVYVIPAVGNSANASVAASRLGLKSAIVSNLGDDYFGKESLEALKKEKVSTEYIKIYKGRKTNYHYVLWYEDDRTILIKHEKYDSELPEIDNPGWIYLSSLGSESVSHNTIQEFLIGHPDIKLAFQPGTFQIELGKDTLAYFYKRAEVFFCNREEAKRILQTREDDIWKLLFQLKDVGPRIVIITDGKKGAYSYNGKEALFMPPYPDPKPPFERTGAGDAFSSTFIAALALGLDVREALKWAPINSMSVVQQVGARAGLLSREQLEEYLVKAPPNYEPQPL